MYYKAWREDQRKQLLATYDDGHLSHGYESTAYLLPASDPRPFPGVRLISGGHG